MQVVIFSTVFKEKDTASIQSLIDILHERGLNIYIYEPFLNQIKGKVKMKKAIGIFQNHKDLKVKKIDFFITLGGDGTILEAMTHIRNSGVPVMGINFGRLGFMASIENKRLDEAIDALLQGRYIIEKRSMLYLESSAPLFDGFPIALNDFTLLKRDTSSMITIHTYVNGIYLNSYWADGLILATPTGSTAYSLSCGGPIIFPNSGNFVITPVAPHNLNVRPIVVSDDSIITFQVEGRSKNYLCTLDSRTEIISSEIELAVRRNDFPICIIQLEDTRFIDSLHAKLGWGHDQRNK